MTLPNAKMPKQEPRPLSLVEEKRQQAQHDLDHWSKVAALPELSTKAAEWAHVAEKSDLGIAEQHGVTFCAGLATEGLKPFADSSGRTARRRNLAVLPCTQTESSSRRGDLPAENPRNANAGALVRQARIKSHSRMTITMRYLRAVFILRNSLPLYTSTCVHPARSRSSRAQCIFAVTLLFCPNKSTSLGATRFKTRGGVKAPVLNVHRP
jgi:hypothetical protein